MKGTWQIWEIMLSSNTISGTLGCHFGSNGVTILARFVHICSVGEHSYMSRGANGVAEEFECPLMKPYSLQQQDWCDDRSPGPENQMSLWAQERGSPAGVGAAQRESRSPVWPLRQLLQGEKRISPTHQHFYIYGWVCVSLCLLFSSI